MKRLLPLLCLQFLCLTGCLQSQRHGLIYKEDTERRYLQIQKADPGTEEAGVAEVTHRRNRKPLRYASGDLHFVLREIYGVERPRIVIETADPNGYKVTYLSDDEQVLESVTDKLNLRLLNEEREMHALVISITGETHHLKQVPQPGQPQWDTYMTHEGWPLNGVTMDELALFLESHYRRPVVNRTGLTGYFSFILRNETVMNFPRASGDVKQLDDTGLQIDWRLSKVNTLVIKD